MVLGSSIIPESALERIGAHRPAKRRGPGESRLNALVWRRGGGKLPE